MDFAWELLVYVLISSCQEREWDTDDFKKKELGLQIFALQTELCEAQAVDQHLKYYYCNTTPL